MHETGVHDQIVGVMALLGEAGGMFGVLLLGPRLVEDLYILEGLKICKY